MFCVCERIEGAVALLIHVEVEAAASIRGRGRGGQHRGGLRGDLPTNICSDIPCNPDRKCDSMQNDQNESRSSVSENLLWV